MLRVDYVLSLCNGCGLGRCDDNGWDVQGWCWVSGVKAGVAGRRVGEGVVVVAYSGHGGVFVATLAAGICALAVEVVGGGGVEIFCVFGRGVVVWGNSSSVPGLEPKMPALGVGMWEEADQCVGD